MMAKYIYVYHGGEHPKTEEEIAGVMGQWKSWLGGMAESLVDGGNPVGMSTTVHSDGTTTEDGGSNPVGGYTLVNADSKDKAVEMAKGCPILMAGGSVEVAECIEIDM